MKRLISIAVLSFVLCSGFICTGSQIHKATIAEHDFKTVVQGFETAEIAEFTAGRVDPATHQLIQKGVIQVSQSAAELVKFLQNGDKAGALTIITQIDSSLQILLADGVLHIKNQTTQANLQVALEAVIAIVNNVQIALS